MLALTLPRSSILARRATMPATRSRPSCSWKISRGIAHCSRGCCERGNDHRFYFFSMKIHETPLHPQILCATPGANCRDGSAFQHLSQDIFDGCRAHIRENLAYLGFRYRQKAVQYRCLDAGSFGYLIRIHRRKALVQFLIALVKHA